MAQSSRSSALPASASKAVHEAPPELYFVVSAVFHYLGPSFAVLLFARVEVLGVAWLRIASAAVILAAWRRPWALLAALDRDGRRLIVTWGVVLALMNACFYTAISRLPLGTVAAIEFLPVIALAAVGVRSARNVLALLLAVPGVYLLTDVRLAGEPLAIAFALPMRSSSRSTSCSPTGSPSARCSAASTGSRSPCSSRSWPSRRWVAGTLLPR